MSLADELRGAAPRGFRLAFPPGWRHYPVDERGRDAMLRDVAERSKAAARPDLDAALRRKVREQFEALRRTRGVAMYVPAEGASTESGMPMSVVASRWVAQSGRTVEEDVRDRAGADVQRIELPHAVLLRWVQDRDGASTREGVLTRTVSYVYPEPEEGARTGMLLTAGILHLGAEETEWVTAGMVELADAIAETFRWS
ncbi:hypothetical protein [Agrococcus sp. Ld7]|uniref:hypothetical protein n=1 Tax=Agrococcus sp. Ld7 TaxID=649148 RepID=UPI00386CAE8D